MLCQVEQDINIYESKCVDSDLAHEHWKWCFESELKFLQEHVIKQNLKLKDVGEIKECIDELFEESKDFNYNERSYDFTSEFQDFIDNL